MAQHDYAIANGVGAVVRSDLNDVLEAIATNNSGAAAPETTFPHQWWFDSTNDILKQRNGANSAWVSVGAKDGSGWRPFFNGTELTLMGQAEAEAGTSTTPRITNALRMAQAIAAQASSTAANVTYDDTDTGLGDNVQAALDNVAIAETAVQSGLSGETEIDFTSLPAGLKRITIQMEQVGMSGSNELLVQLGDAGGVETSGYISVGLTGSSTIGSIDGAAGFIVRIQDSSRTMRGVMVIERITGNLWVATHLGRIASGLGVWGSGTKELSAELDRIRLQSTSTNTISAANVKLLLEK